MGPAPGGEGPLAGAAGGDPLQLLRPQAQPSDRAAPTFPRPHLAPSGANLSLQALKHEHVMVPQMVLINLPLGGHLCLGPELGTPTESLPYLLCSLEEDWAGESPVLLKDTGRGRQWRGMGQQGKTGLGAPTEAEVAVDSVREMSGPHILVPPGPSALKVGANLRELRC